MSPITNCVCCESYARWYVKMSSAIVLVTDRMIICSFNGASQIILTYRAPADRSKFHGARGIWRVSMTTRHRLFPLTAAAKNHQSPSDFRYFLYSKCRATVAIPADKRFTRRHRITAGVSGVSATLILSQFVFRTSQETPVLWLRCCAFYFILFLTLVIMFSSVYFHPR